MSTKLVNGMALLKGTAVAVVSAVKKSILKFDSAGLELVDGRPMEPPLGYEPSVSLHEQIAMAVRNHAVQEAIKAAGGETFEEAEDFDVGDDFDPTSPYEAYFEPITERDVDRLVHAGFIVKGEPPVDPTNGSVAPVQNAPLAVPLPAPTEQHTPGKPA